MLPLILIFFAGNIVFTIFSLVLGVLGFMELKIAFSKKGVCIPVLFAAIIPVFLFLFSIEKLNPFTMGILVLGMILCFVIQILREKISISDSAFTIFSILYAFIPFWLISRIYVLENGLKYTVLIFIIAFVTDIFACITGKYFGKHKLLPNISPNKTIEGSVGGIIGTLIICLIYGHFTNIPLLWMLPVSVWGSIIAQVGDLFASSIKRHCEIKDFSNLIPGHGGILDRFDSVIFVTILISVMILII